MVTVLVGLLMVSNLRYRSFKDLDMKNRIPFMVAVTVMLVFTVIFIQPPLVLFSLAALYALSGMVMTALELHRRRRDHRREEEGGGAAPP